MENRLDPVKVREARKRLEAELVVQDSMVRDPDLLTEDLRLLLAALDEGREASAPFARYDFPEADGWCGPHRLELLADTAGGLVDSFTVDDFRRLAAFNELVSQEKPDGG